MSVTNATSRGFSGTRFQKGGKSRTWLVSESERQFLRTLRGKENFKEMMGLEY